MNVDDPLAWAAYAEQDWKLAVSLLRRKHPPSMAICFHAQQSAEKYRWKLPKPCGALPTSGWG